MRRRLALVVIGLTALGALQACATRGSQVADTTNPNASAGADASTSDFDQVIFDVAGLIGGEYLALFQDRRVVNVTPPPDGEPGTADFRQWPLTQEAFDQILALAQAQVPDVGTDEHDTVGATDELVALMTAESSRAAPARSWVPVMQGIVLREAAPEAAASDAAPWPFLATPSEMLAIATGPNRDLVCLERSDAVAAFELLDDPAATTGTVPLAVDGTTWTVEVVRTLPGQDRTGGPCPA